MDDIFKGNAALLNSLLGVLGPERCFDDGASRTHLAALRCVVGACHHPPDDDDSMAALYDRFLIRRTVAPLTPAGRLALLDEPGETWGASQPTRAQRLHSFSAGELDAIREGAWSVLPQDVAFVLAELPDFLRSSANVVVSDRRMAAAANLLKVAAYTDGRDAVDLYDCLLLRHVLWDRQSDLVHLDSWFAEKLAGAQVAWMEKAVTALLREAFLACETENKGEELKEVATGGLGTAECSRLRRSLLPFRAALAQRSTAPHTVAAESTTGHRATASELAVLQSHRWLTIEDLSVLRWRRQRAWHKRERNALANAEAERLTSLRSACEELEALLQQPPVHAHALLCVAPRLGKAVLGNLLGANASMWQLRRGLEICESVCGREFNQRLWSRMMNPVHSGGQSRQVSHHNTDFY